MSQANFDLAENMYWGDIQSNPETAIADTTYYPASASFIDVSGFERFAFIIRAGALDTATTFAVRQDTSATVTASVKAVTDATVTVGTGDDGERFMIMVNTDQLDTANGFKYVTLYSTGGAGGNDYASLDFVAWGAINKPVTQPATFPAANRVRVLA